MVDAVLRDAVTRAGQRRAEVAGHLHELTAALVRASGAMAGRLGDGATLFPLGAGLSAIDAAHVTVEFIHPVIVRKRSLASLTLQPGHVAQARPDDVVLGLDLCDDPSTTDALATAHVTGCLTVALTTSHRPGVDHDLAVGTADPLLARELQVTGYHLLWELVHEFLDGASAGADRAPDGLGNLYPFLYERDEAADGDGDPTGHLEASTRAKATEIAELRARVLRDQADALATVASLIRDCGERGGTVWTFGNGGSSTDAQAVAHVLSTHDLPGQARRASALTNDIATITALSNDVNFDVSFARMLRSLARPGDIAMGLSTSGGSANVLAALEEADDRGLVTVGLAGYDGGDMADLDALDHLMVVPSSSVHRIQEAQTTLAHVLVELARMPVG